MRASMRFGLAALLALCFVLIKRHIDCIQVEEEVKAASKLPYWPFGVLRQELKGANDVGNPAGSDALLTKIDGDKSKNADYDVLHDQQEPAKNSVYHTVPISTPNDRTIVVGKLKGQDTDWVTSELNEWRSVVYTLDDLSAPLHTPLNKGLESLAYLQFIIEHYHNMPATTIFLQADRSGSPQVWQGSYKNQIMKRGYDNVRSINNLQLDYVQQEGYVNLRCALSPGCPDEIQPFRTPRDPDRKTEMAFAAAWEQLFNNTNVPKVVAVPCCSQFAVSRDRVLRRPFSDYVRFYNWLVTTDLPDDVSTRVLEYSWHIIFGKDPVHCPEMRQCYRDVYGRSF